MAGIVLENSGDGIKLARKIRNMNNEKSSMLSIEFLEDNRKIQLNGEVVYLPNEIDTKQECSDIIGEVIETEDCLCIIDIVRPKTVNVHLDSELVAEISAIQECFLNKKANYSKQKMKDATQHEVMLAVLRRGIHQFKKDLGI